jgi:CheY-like chemotaxis protein
VSEQADRNQPKVATATSMLIYGTMHIVDGPTRKGNGMPTPFPANCCALVVQDGLEQALDLACTLAGFGCGVVVGYAESALEALRVSGGRCPNFALFDASLPANDVVSITETLIRLEVPFAVTGMEDADLDRPVLREALRLAKPFDPLELHRTASALHQIDLRSRIAAADRRISEGRMRLAKQVRLIERLEAAGTPVAMADSLLREIGRTLRIIRVSRSLLCQQLKVYRS